MEGAEAGLPYSLPKCYNCKAHAWSNPEQDRLPVLNHLRYTWTCFCGNKMIWCPPEAGNLVEPTL